jgi:hypothetical protein
MTQLEHPLYNNLIRWSQVTLSTTFPVANLYTDFGGLMTIAPLFGIQTDWPHYRLIPLPDQNAGPQSIYSFLPQPNLDPLFLRMPPYLKGAFANRSIQFNHYLPVRHNIVSDPDPVIINSDLDAGQSG